MFAVDIDIPDRVVTVCRLKSAPVVTQAQVTREGRIIPNDSVIARDILDPLARGAFSIGCVEDLDKFLTVRPFSGKEDDPDLWC